MKKSIRIFLSKHFTSQYEWVAKSLRDEDFQVDMRVDDAEEILNGSHDNAELDLIIVTLAELMPILGEEEARQKFLVRSIPTIAITGHKKGRDYIRNLNMIHIDCILSRDLLFVGTAAHYLLERVQLCDKLKEAAVINEKQVSSFFGRQSIPQQNPGATILLVEHDGVHGAIIARMIQEMGYQVKVAENAAEALAIFQKHNVDVVLMDTQIPSPGGVEITRRIRLLEEKRGGHTPVIAVAAQAQSGEREKYLASGMDEYICKPVNVNILRDKISRFVSNPELKRSALPSELTVIGELSGCHAVDPDSVLEGIITRTRILARAVGAVDPMLLEADIQQIGRLAELVGAVEIKRTAFKLLLAVRRGERDEIDRFSAIIQEECMRGIRGRF